MPRYLIHYIMKEGSFTYLYFFLYKLRHIIAIILSLLSIFLLNHKNIFTNYINNNITRTIISIHSIISKQYVKASNIRSNIKKYINVTAKNELLVTENFILTQKLRQAEVEVKNNAILKQLLHIIENNYYNFITVKIISKNFNTTHMHLLIEAGTNDGIQIDDVVSYNNQLIGKVIEVSEYSAKVMTILDLQSRVPVKFYNSAQQAIISGLSDKTMLKIEYLNNHSPITKGENVITSGIGGIYPLGLTVGKTIYINDKVFIKSETDWDKINYVIVNNQKLR